MFDSGHGCFGGIMLVTDGRAFACGELGHGILLPVSRGRHSPRLSSQDHERCEALQISLPAMPQPPSTCGVDAGIRLSKFSHETKRIPRCPPYDGLSRVRSISHKCSAEKSSRPKRVVETTCTANRTPDAAVWIPRRYTTGPRYFLIHIPG